MTDKTKAQDALRFLSQWDFELRDMEEFDDCVGVVDKIRTALQREVDLEKVKEALKFYADPKSYDFIHGVTSYMPIEVDDGYKAREALALLEQGKEWE